MKRIGHLPKMLFYWIWHIRIKATEVIFVLWDFRTFTKCGTCSKLWRWFGFIFSLLTSFLWGFRRIIQVVDRNRIVDSIRYSTVYQYGTYSTHCSYSNCIYAFGLLALKLLGLWRFLKIRDSFEMLWWWYKIWKERSIHDFGKLI